MRRLAMCGSALVLGALVMGCVGLIPMVQPVDPAQAQAMANQQVDAIMVQRVEVARQAAQASPGAFQPATVFARELESAYVSGTVSRGVLDGPTLLAEALSSLQAAAGVDPAQAHVCQALEGTLRIASGDRDGGLAALRTSMETAPNLYALPPLLALMNPQTDAQEIATLCTRTRERVADDRERYAVLDHCQATSAAPDLAGRLAWASAEDRAFYQAQRAEFERQQAAEAAEAQRRSEEERARLHASFSNPANGSSGGSGSSGGGGSSGSSGPAVVSVTIRSDCPRTASVFYGDKPKYGSGTRSTISSNSVNSHSFRPGDMFWVIDESENGLASVKVTEGMRELTIGRDCASVSAR